MHNAGAAVAAALLVRQHQPDGQITPGTVIVLHTVTLSGAASVSGSSGAATTYQWSIPI